MGLRIVDLPAESWARGRGAPCRMNHVPCSMNYAARSMCHAPCISDMLKGSAMHCTLVQRTMYHVQRIRDALYVARHHLRHSVHEAGCVDPGLQRSRHLAQSSSLRSRHRTLARKSPRCLYCSVLLYCSTTPHSYLALHSILLTFPPAVY